MYCQWQTQIVALLSFGQITKMTNGHVINPPLCIFWKVSSPAHPPENLPLKSDTSPSKEPKATSANTEVLEYPKPQPPLPRNPTMAVEQTNKKQKQYWLSQNA